MTPFSWFTDSGLSLVRESFSGRIAICAGPGDAASFAWTFRVVTLSWYLTMKSQFRPAFDLTVSPSNKLAVPKYSEKMKNRVTWPKDLRAPSTATSRKIAENAADWIERWNKEIGL